MKLIRRIYSGTKEDIEKKIQEGGTILGYATNPSSTGGYTTHNVIIVEEDKN